VHEKLDTLNALGDQRESIFSPSAVTTAMSTPGEKIFQPFMSVEGNDELPHSMQKLSLAKGKSKRIS
jgi:hypothetical protein